jgi:hypothetical protein
MEHNQSFCMTRASCNTCSLRSTPLRQTGFCTNIGPSINALPNHKLDQNQFTLSLAHAIAKDKKQIPHTETIRNPVIGRADVTPFFKAFERFTSCTGTNIVTEDMHTALPKNSAIMTRVMINLRGGYCRENCERV